MNVKRALLFGLPVLVVVGLVGRRLVELRTKDAETKQAANGRKGRAQQVETAVAGPRKIVRTLTLTGSATPPNTVRLSPRVAGRLIEVGPRPGDRVQAGQVLARIDPAQVEAQVTQAQANAAQARSRLAEAQANAGSTGVGLTQAVQTQIAAVGRAQAELSASQRNVASQLAAVRATVADIEARISAAQADVASARAAVVAAEANLNNAQVRFNRTDQLFRGGFIAAQDLDDARAQVAVQQGALGVARATVDARLKTVGSLRQQRAAAAAQVSITQRTAQAGVQTNQAALKQANAALKTARSNTSGVQAFQQNLAALQAAVSAADAAVRQAEAQRTDLALTSPITGTVTDRSADPGALASPGTPVITVVDLKRTLFTAGVPIEEGQSIRPGTPAAIVFDGLPGRTFQAPVTRVNQAAELSSRQFGIEIEIPNPDEAIRPGFFGRASIAVETIDCPVAIPLSAVQSGKVTVVGADGKAQPRDVKTGLDDGQYVQILDGVKAGDRVVTLTYSAPRQGQQVSTEADRAKRRNGRGGGQGARGGQGNGGQSGGDTGGGTGAGTPGGGAGGSSGGGRRRGGGGGGAASGDASNPPNGPGGGPPSVSQGAAPNPPPNAPGPDAPLQGQAGGGGSVAPSQGGRL